MVNTVIVFSQREIQLVQTDQDKRVVLLWTSVPLPDETIKRGELVNHKLAAAALGQLFTQIKTSLEEIMLVIPEDAVVSKSITLPHINKREINEAVRWEAESFLHFPLNQAVLDWKMLFANGNCHVLFQAIPQVVVEAYISLFEDNHLRINSISTPAMALVHLAEQKPGIRLLIYISHTEAILTLARDQEVIATSIMTFTEKMPENLKQTVLRMARYYQKFPIAWIQIGGAGTNNEIVKALQSLQLPIIGFHLPIAVKDPQIANTYLLAISASSTQAAPPHDQASINLLPDWYVNRSFLQSQLAFWQKLLMVTTVFGLVLILGLGAVYLWLAQQEQVFTKSLNMPSVVTKEALEAASVTNNLATMTIALAPVDHFPIDLIDRIQAIDPKRTITIGRLEFSYPDKRGTIIGMAKDRTALVDYKHNLEQLPGIASIQLPVSSYVEETNIPFQVFMTFTKDIALLNTIVQSKK